MVDSPVASLESPRWLAVTPVYTVSAKVRELQRLDLSARRGHSVLTCDCDACACEITDQTTAVPHGTREFKSHPLRQ